VVVVTVEVESKCFVVLVAGFYLSLSMLIFLSRSRFTAAMGAAAAMVVAVAAARLAEVAMEEEVADLAVAVVALGILVEHGKRHYCYYYTLLLSIVSRTHYTSCTHAPATLYLELRPDVPFFLSLFGEAIICIIILDFMSIIIKTILSNKNVKSL
jgi:hypothetical protein